MRLSPTDNESMSHGHRYVSLLSVLSTLYSFSAAIPPNFIKRHVQNFVLPVFFLGVFLFPPIYDLSLPPPNMVATDTLSFYSTLLFNKDTTRQSHRLSFLASHWSSIGYNSLVASHIPYSPPPFPSYLFYLPLAFVLCLLIHLTRYVSDPDG